MGKAVFFSGAGLSAGSGLGTFRSSGGLWEKYDINKVCNYNTWLDNYDIVHEFYNMRREEYLNAKPNAMHNAIGELQKRYGSEKVIVITQNIDDLLEQSGCVDVLHVHGRVYFMRCIGCGLEFEIQTHFKGGKCENCGGTVFKPSIVFFGEQAPNYVPMYEKINSLTDKDVIAVIGTEGSVVPIADILGSKYGGVKGRRLLCNLERSPYINDKHFDKVLYKKAETAVLEVADYVEDILNMPENG